MRGISQHLPDLPLTEAERQRLRVIFYETLELSNAAIDLASRESERD